MRGILSRRGRVQFRPYRLTDYLTDCLTDASEKLRVHILNGSGGRTHEDTDLWMQSLSGGEGHTQEDAGL